MKNVTITLEDDVARWAKIWAAKHDSSVSRMVGELLRVHMRDEQSYETAKQAYRDRTPVALGEAGGRYPRRDELHER